MIYNHEHISPYLARLFALIHPSHANLFEFREVKAGGHRDDFDELRADL